MYKLLTYRLYNHLIVHYQMCSGSFKQVIDKLRAYKAYVGLVKWKIPVYGVSEGEALCDWIY